MAYLPTSTVLVSAATRRAGLAIAMVAAMAMGGCTGLPKDVDRPVTIALQAPSDTALGQLVTARRAAQGARQPSGFVLLSGPQAAYSSRLALVDAAQKTLDLQYYAIHADASSERLLLSVVAAAQRGVRVRVLLDDFHSTGRDAQVMRLAFVPNIEMRMFNPLTGARGSSLGRMFSLLGDFARVQQRMHNKLFIADNAMGVAGGRNLGDAYFGNSDSGNFVDLDVLAAGPIVQELSRSFDSYWNNERAYPVQSLVTRDELDNLRKNIRASDAVQRERSAGQGGAPAPDTQPPPATGNGLRPLSVHGSGTTNPWTLKRSLLSGHQPLCLWTSPPRFRLMAHPLPRCPPTSLPNPPKSRQHCGGLGHRLQEPH
ncbi:phospholipase D-like protein [Acidovorax sp. 69]|nr:phospholipase D-like protein [Acidovorax sp. 69]